MIRDRTKLLAMRAKRTAAGLCRQCGRNAEGFATCWHCRQKRADRYRRRYKGPALRKEWRESARARGGAIKARERDRKADRRAEGLCQYCENPSKQYAGCLECRAKKAAQHLARRKA